MNTWKAEKENIIINKLQKAVSPGEEDKGIKGE